MTGNTTTEITAETINGFLDQFGAVRVCPATDSAPAHLAAADQVLGDITDLEDYFGPGLDGEYKGYRLARGRSNQDRYDGPILHPSEFIGDSLARYMATSPACGRSCTAPTLMTATANWSDGRWPTTRCRESLKNMP